jgi:hypothetical protein
MSHSTVAIAVTSRPATPDKEHRTVIPAGRGAEWRLVTHVREERRGLHRVLIEEQGWEYVGKPANKVRRETTKIVGEAVEMSLISEAEGRKRRRGIVISDASLADALAEAATSGKPLPPSSPLREFVDEKSSDDAEVHVIEAA